MTAATCGTLATACIAGQSDRPRCAGRGAFAALCLICAVVAMSGCIPRVPQDIETVRAVRTIEVAVQQPIYTGRFTVEGWLDGTKEQMTAAFEPLLHIKKYAEDEFTRELQQALPDRRVICTRQVPAEASVLHSPSADALVLEVHPMLHFDGDASVWMEELFPTRLMPTLGRQGQLASAFVYGGVWVAPPGEGASRPEADTGIRYPLNIRAIFTPAGKLAVPGPELTQAIDAWIQRRAKQVAHDLAYALTQP